MKRLLAHATCVFAFLFATCTLFSSCNSCIGKEHLESFDFRIVDFQKENQVGSLEHARDVTLTSNGKDLIQGFYEHPENGVVFILNYKDLSNGEIAGLLELGVDDNLDVKLQIKQNFDNCNNYNIVELIQVGNFDYSVATVVDFVK